VLSALFSAWLLLWVSRWIGGWLLERFDALGLLAFVGLLFMMFGGRVRAWWATACAAARRAAAAPGDGRRRRRWAALALGCGAALLLLFGRVPLNVVGDFTVSPIHNHDVRAEVPGIIERVLVAEGDTVEAGQLLVALADRDLAAELEQVRAEIVERRARQRLLVAGTRAEEIAVAEAAVAKARDRLRYARHHLDRLESLHREKLSSLKQYDEAREAAAVRARELEESRRSLELLLAGARSEEIEAVAAEVSRLETRAAHLEDRLARVRIESPIAGVVTTPKLEERVGELVQAGDLVLEVHDLATVSVEIAVPEDQISEVREGQPVRLRARAAPGRELRGSVVAIAPTARASERDWEPPTITITTRVENADGGLRPRMTGTAKIGCGERSFLQLAARRISRSMGIEVWTWW
jgi:HlyD family secretion protein